MQSLTSCNLLTKSFVDRRACSITAFDPNRADTTVIVSSNMDCGPILLPGTTHRVRRPDGGWCPPPSLINTTPVPTVKYCPSEEATGPKVEGDRGQHGGHLFCGEPVAVLPWRSGKWGVCEREGMTKLGKQGLSVSIVTRLPISFSSPRRQTGQTNMRTHSHPSAHLADSRFDGLPLRLSNGHPHFAGGRQRQITRVHFDLDRIST